MQRAIVCFAFLLLLINSISMARTDVFGSGALLLRIRIPGCHSIGKEVSNFDFEGGCQRRDDQKCGISFAALDSPNIGPMVFRPVGKLFLAPTPLLAEGTQSLTKFPLRRLHIGMKPR